MKKRLEAVLPEGSTITMYECRVSLCRIETVHPDMGHYNRFARAAFMTRASMILNAPGITVAAPGDGPKVTGVAFLAMEGHLLPADP